MGRRGRSAPAPPVGPTEAVDQLLADPRVGWLPVKHHSPACAWHVRAYLRAMRPAAVLIEAPSDAAPLLPWLLHPDTRGPLAVLMAFTDKSAPKEGGGNRVRWMWPVLPYDPEWVALRTATEIGAEVHLIDAPVRAIHAAGGSRAELDRDLGPEAYLSAIAHRAGRPGFDRMWEAAFEHAPASRATDAFRRDVLTLGWCARASGGAVDAVTALREAHMRACVDDALSAHPDRTVAVVTGAFHVAGIAQTKGKRARPRSDPHAVAVIAAASCAALARRGVAWPGWWSLRWAALDDGPNSEVAALAAIASAARASGAPVGTADAIGAVEVARGLSGLRAHRAAGSGVTVEDVIDGARSALEKGTAGSAVVEAAIAQVLVGTTRGELPPGAGRPPLAEDFWSEVAVHRLVLGDDVREVRCSPRDSERHRAKSAFLHRCRLLAVPMFGPIDADGAVFRGPDWVERQDLHLVAERWGVRGDPSIDDRLLELSERGGTVAEVAADLLGSLRTEAGEDVAARARLVLEAARMRLMDLLPALLAELGVAVAGAASFVGLVEAMLDLALLADDRAELPTHEDEAVRRVFAETYARACLALPAVARIAEGDVDEVVDALTALTRLAVTRRDLDRGLLVERMSLADDPGTLPRIRGTLHGLLSGAGAFGVDAIAGELSGYLRGTVDEVRRGGHYLQGVLAASRSTFLRSSALLGAVHAVVVRLSDEAFAAVLPDLRRAFAVFVPAELERIGERVAERIGREQGGGLTPVSPGGTSILGALDRELGDRLHSWLDSSE